MHKQPRQKTLQSKTVNLEHVFKYPEAREAFEKLVGPDLDAKWLLKAIQTIVKIPQRRGDLVSGRTDRQVRDFPDRIEGWANEIADLNTKSGLLYEIEIGSIVERTLGRTASSPSWSVIASLPPDPTNAWITHGVCAQPAEVFEHLPELLRAYAAYLRFAIGENRQGWSELQQFAIAQRPVILIWLRVAERPARGAMNSGPAVPRFTHHAVP